MIATIEYIARKFEEYNKLCFGSQLTLPTICLSRARRYLGQLTYIRRRRMDDTWFNSDFKLHISVRINRPEAELDDTLLHEMIHYWILSNQLQDTSPHGRLFIRKMNEINTTHNRHIAVSHRVSPEEYDKDLERRQHLICVSRLRDGRCGVTVAARTRLFQLWNSMPLFPGLLECKWFVSSDPFFNRFPRALTPKIYPLPPEELEAHLSDAVELVRTGNVIGTRRSQ